MTALSSEQQLLLDIVETWQPSELPEYRGFRCAYCQQYQNAAWHHWLYSGGYRVPLHLCQGCEEAFQDGTLHVAAAKKQLLNRQIFGQGYPYSSVAQLQFAAIVARWPKTDEPLYKPYSCDHCHAELLIDQNDGVRKGYHVWWKMPDGNTLAELHFHKKCAALFGIGI